jgi:hypothetical protein
MKDIWIFRYLSRVALKVTRLILIITSSIICFIFGLFFAVCLRLVRRNSMKDSKKVFIGLHEIANNIISIGDCLSKNGYKCDVLIVSNSWYGLEPPSTTANLKIRYLGHKSSQIKKILIEALLPFYFFKYLVANQVFFFIWKRSFMWCSIDYLLIKLAGIKLIVMNCGGDVRYRAMQRHIDLSKGLNRWPNDDLSLKDCISKLYRQSISEVFGRVISTPNAVTFQRGQLFHFQFPQKELLFSKKLTNEICSILHCPSDRYVKGTDVVLKAIKKIRNEGLSFKFELIENRKNDYVLEMLQSTDIVVDQPGTWVARFAVEGMASGCCVVGGNRTKYMYRKESPVIQFEPDTDHLANELRKLILSQDLRQEKMDNCFHFWEENYSYNSYINYFQKVCDGTGLTYGPLPNQKEILLKGNHSWLERMIIRLAYHPKKSS